MKNRPTTVPVRVGDRLEVEVEARGQGPDAVARVGDYVVLIPDVLPGERVLVEVTSAARKFGRAAPRAVLRPSPDRVAPRCAHVPACGGCHLQHQDYPAQVRDKADGLRRALRHALGEAAPPVGEVVVPADPWGGRHKVVLHLDGEGERLVGGFHRRRSLELVEVRECPAADPAALALAFAAVGALRRLRLAAWRPRRPDGVLRLVVVRRSAGTGEAHVVIVATRPDLPRLREVAAELRARGATAVSLNVNDDPAVPQLGPRTVTLCGPRRIRERIGEFDYLLSPASFFQTAPAGAEALVREVLRGLRPRPEDDVADLYCGGGLLSLPLARAARRVLGVEARPAAVADATVSARRAKLRNARFVSARVEHALPRLRELMPRPAALVLDPPRGGCAAGVVAGLAELGPARVAYVSCDERALARDLRDFRAAGYLARAVAPIDMFPHTSHLEAVAILEPA